MSDAPRGTAKELVCQECGRWTDPLDAFCECGADAEEFREPTLEERVTRLEKNCDPR